MADDTPAALAAAPGRRRWSLLVPVIAALAGLLFTTSARTAAGTSLREDRRPELTRLIEERQTQVATGGRARPPLCALRSTPRPGPRPVRTDASRPSRPRADASRAAAGFTAVHGPGLAVELDDAPRRPDGGLPVGARPDDVVVHQQDVQSVVNALWAGGAEAMTIMGIRVISTSAVRCVGNTLLLHGLVFSPPFRIEAIGDQDRMRAALAADPGVRAFRDAVDRVRSRLPRGRPGRHRRPGPHGFRVARLRHGGAGMTIYTSDWQNRDGGSEAPDAAAPGPPPVAEAAPVAAGDPHRGRIQPDRGHPDRAGLHCGWLRAAVRWPEVLPDRDGPHPRTRPGSQAAQGLHPAGPPAPAPLRPGALDPQHRPDHRRDDDHARADPAAVRRVRGLGQGGHRQRPPARPRLAAHPGVGRHPDPTASRRPGDPGPDPGQLAAPPGGSIARLYIPRLGKHWVVVAGRAAGRHPVRARATTRTPRCPVRSATSPSPATAARPSSGTWTGCRSATRSWWRPRPRTSSTA